MEDVEVPQYFVCPISLQIMKDPVTAITGITYDRESIEQWLFKGKNTTCPVTNQPLPRDSDLTPNHTLRRLIQAWCTLNASKGVDRIPTPKSPLDRLHVLKLIRELSVPHLQLQSLKKMEGLAAENERNRRCMAEAGVAARMLSFVVAAFKKGETSGLEEALSLLHFVWSFTSETRLLVKDNHDYIEALTWILVHEMDNHAAVKTHAVVILKKIVELASKNLLQGLKPDFFMEILKVLKDKVSQQATKACLHVLLEACPWGGNKTKIMEAGAVFELIELELGMPEKRTTELIMGVLNHLCSTADGRAQFLRHGGGVALVAKRILRVSPTVDDQATRILALICKFSASNEVIQEMLRVGAVSKLCMVLQADCEKHVKERARMVLRMHNNVWRNSPCIQVYLLTRHAR